LRAALPLALILLAGCRTPAPPPDLPRVPGLLYWFWPPGILENGEIERQLAEMGRRAPVSLVFVTPRGPFNGMDLTDTRRFRPELRRAAAAARRNGLALGLECRYTAFLREAVPAGERQGVVTLVEAEVGPDGRADAAVRAPPLLFELRPTGRRLLHARLEGGAPCPAALEDGRLRAAPGPAHAGRRVLAAVLHEYDYPDLFSEWYPRVFRSTLGAYADLGLAGAALDEFSTIPIHELGYETTRLWSDRFAARYRAAEGRALEEDLLAERDGPREVRIAAANAQLELVRARLEEVEAAFHRTVREVLGPGAFVGVHPTVFNELPREVPATALDWWGVRRDFGQTDEGTSYPVRLALAYKAGGPAWFNMFYSRRLDDFLDEIAECARFGGRVHLHAWNDVVGYGVSLDRPEVWERLGPALRKVALLDEVQEALPRPDLLIVFGWRSVTCRADHPHQFGRLQKVWQVARDLWRAGWRCALVPDSEIESGALRVEEGAIRYGPARFPALVFLHPEYIRDESRRFLGEVERARVPLFVYGPATRDHRGRPAPLDLARFELNVSPGTLRARGVAPTGFPEGSRLLDGSLVLVDRASLAGGPEARVARDLDGHALEARFRGVLLVRLRADGSLDRVAAGDLRELRIDGRVVAGQDPPADFVLGMPAR